MQQKYVRVYVLYMVVQTASFLYLYTGTSYLYIYTYVVQTLENNMFLCNWK